MTERWKNLFFSSTFSGYFFGYLTIHRNSPLRLFSSWPHQWLTLPSIAAASCCNTLTHMQQTIPPPSLLRLEQKELDSDLLPRAYTNPHPHITAMSQSSRLTVWANKPAAQLLGTTLFI